MKQPGFFQLIRPRCVAALLTWSVLTAQAVQPSGGNGCTINSGSGLNFGSYDVFSLSETTGNGSFAVQSCTNGKSSYTATFSTGSGTYTTRTMTMIGSTDKLQYNLYTDMAYTNILGDSPFSGTGSTSTSGGSQSIYGRIPAGQDVSAGSYSDTITITISF